MTSAETRLREALHQAGSVAVGTSTSINSRDGTRGRSGAGGLPLRRDAGVVVASVVWTVSGGGSDAGKATLVPAANPTATG